MSIRHAVPADVGTLADIEAASYPPAEGASRQSIAGRVAVYPDHFWLLDEDGGVKAFVNGLVTDQPDLTDAMYDDPHLHTPEGGWQMIFSVVTASRVLRQVCADADLSTLALHTSVGCISLQNASRTALCYATNTIK